MVSINCLCLGKTSFDDTFVVNIANDSDICGSLININNLRISDLKFLIWNKKKATLGINDSDIMDLWKVNIACNDENKLKHVTTEDDIKKELGGKKLVPILLVKKLFLEQSLVDENIHIIVQFPLLLVTGGANLAAFVALVIPEGAGGPNAGTYVNGSEAQIYSRDINNALATIKATFILTHDLIGGDKAWGRAGARPTNRAAPATADAGIAANDNHPIVFPERFSNLNPDDLVKHLRNLERRRAEMRLGLQDRNWQLRADYSDVTQPPLGKQEPVVLTSKSSGVTQEQLQELLKAQAEELTKNFQVQFKQLQGRPVRNPPVYRQQIKPVQPKPQRRVVQTSGS
ncbi:unnamed protein product [Rhizophagus irregularis]|nr:unnamed protein product [Rhizophagus irregularis]